MKRSELTAWLATLAVAAGTLGCADDGAETDGEGGAPSENVEGTGGATGGTNGVTGGTGSTGSTTGGTGGTTPVDPPATAETCGPAASNNPQGALTAHPHIATTISEGYELVSFNFVVVEDGDDRGPLLQLFAEIKNVSSELVCDFLPEVSLDFTELVTLGYADPYHPQYGSTVSSGVADCIPPGGVGFLAGVQRGVSEADLETAETLSIAPEPFISDSYVPATPPLLDAEVTETADGYSLSGSVTYLEDVYNHGLRVLPKDARGLIVGELMAFPGDLGSHAEGSTFEFETDSIDCRFVDYDVIQSWIVED